MKNADLSLVGQVHNNAVEQLHYPSLTDLLISFCGQKMGLLLGQLNICQAPCGRDLCFCLSYFGGSVDLQRALGECNETYSHRII